MLNMSTNASQVHDHFAAFPDELLDDLCRLVKLEQGWVNLLGLVRGKYAHIFLFSDLARVEMMRILGCCAANPDLGLSWLDAATLAQELRGHDTGQQVAGMQDGVRTVAHLCCDRSRGINYMEVSSPPEDAYSVCTVFPSVSDAESVDTSIPTKHACSICTVLPSALDLESADVSI